MTIIPLVFQQGTLFREEDTTFVYLKKDGTFSPQLFV
jgi:hypothetical protein